MDNTFISLELSLNNIIDTEIQKIKEEQNTSLISECVDALLRMEDCEKYKLSHEKLNDNIQKILNGKRNKHISKTVRIILAAAIIALLAMFGVFGYAQHKYNIIDFGKYSRITAQEKVKEVGKNITVGYVPEGFTLSNEKHNKHYTTFEYMNGNKMFNVIIQAYTNMNTLNTEYGSLREIRKNGKEYYAFGEETYGAGILRIEHDLLYTVCGNIPEDEMLKIASSVE